MRLLTQLQYQSSHVVDYATAVSEFLRICSGNSATGIISKWTSGGKRIGVELILKYLTIGTHEDKLVLPGDNM